MAPVVLVPVALVAPVEAAVTGPPVLAGLVVVPAGLTDRVVRVVRAALVVRVGLVVRAVPVRVVLVVPVVPAGLTGRVALVVRVVLVRVVLVVRVVPVELTGRVVLPVRAPPVVLAAPVVRVVRVVLAPAVLAVRADLTLTVRVVLGAPVDRRRLLMCSTVSTTEAVRSGVARGTRRMASARPITVRRPRRRYTVSGGTAGPHPGRRRRTGTAHRLLEAGTGRHLPADGTHAGMGRRAT